MKRLMVKMTQKIEYIVDKLPWTYKFFESYYDKVVENEIKLASIKPTDRILCIGGGPCPSTAIQLHQKTGAKVWVIDNDRDAILTARKNIDKLNLSDFIKVKFSDGTNIDAYNFTVVHIALQVYPKNKVFRKITDSCRPGTKIMVRIEDEKFSKLYSLFETDNIRVDSKIYHKKKNLNYTMLHVKTGDVNEEIPYSSTAAVGIAT
ncbi:MAG: hypothetical protein GX339_09070 [Tissierellia bacterium]|nr:hypothetical protein [Tissierellia bacterium]